MTARSKHDADHEERDRADDRDAEHVFQEGGGWRLYQSAAAPVVARSETMYARIASSSSGMKSCSRMG